MSPRPPVRVAIVGCGLIGASWDAPESAGAPTPPSLTHAAAFSRHPGAEVVAFCDADSGRAAQAAQRWGCGRAFDDVAAMLAQQPVELIVVAAASAARLSVVAPALAAGVRTLVIEKPLAATLAESRALLAALDAAGATALVNYSRHWDPSLHDLQQRLERGEFGRLQRLLGSYGKGLSNNGSHMIDLAGLLCGARPVAARALGSPLPDGESDWCGGADPAVDAQVRFEDGRGERIQLDLLATDASAFSCFELKLIGRNAVAEIALGGRRIELTPVGADPDFPGYRVPGTRQSLPALALTAMDRMADEAVRLACGELGQPSCDARSALRTAMTVQAIRDSARQGGAWAAIDEPPRAASAAAAASTTAAAAPARPTISI